MYRKEKEILLNAITKTTIGKDRQTKLELLRYTKSYIEDMLQKKTFSKRSDRVVKGIIEKIIEAEENRTNRYGREFLFQEVNIYLLCRPIDLLINIDNYDRTRLDDIPFKRIVNGTKLLLKKIDLGDKVTLKSTEGINRRYIKGKKKRPTPASITLENLRVRLIIKNNGKVYVLQLFFYDELAIELVEIQKYSTFLCDIIREIILDNASKYPEVIKLEII